MSVSLTKNGLLINGKEVPVYSGTVHYWRLERNLWPEILDKVKSFGFNMIETYIPWGIHEVTPGHYDWGQDDPRKDVEAFFRVCEERQMFLLVRPGPLINAELTDFGFPEWVLLDPEVQARTVTGGIHLDAASGFHPPHQFPVPSYASETFYNYIDGWFAAICPIIARHLSPDGCIVAVQSDNETCYLFHDLPYATDYSPASLNLYGDFLKKKYNNDLSALNSLYRTSYSAFSAVEPPRDCQVEVRTDVPLHIDWIAYKEYQIRWSVARIARMLHAHSINNVPIFHDVAYQLRTPLDVSRMEDHPDIDWVGINLYRNKEGYAGAVRQMRFLAGATRLPFVPEFGCGLWSHHIQTPRPDDHEFITLTAFMYGLKAINFYMLVERDRWQGCPITRHGKERPEYAPFYKNLLRFLSEQRFWEFQRETPILVLFNYDLERYEAMTSNLNFSHADLYNFPPALFKVDLNLDFRWDAATEAAESNKSSWLNRVCHELKSRSLDYDLADSHLGLERLQKYPVVCLQTTDFMDQADQQRLLAYVEQGGHLVLGPGMPYLDPALQPTTVLADHFKDPGTVSHGKGKMSWVSTPEIERTIKVLLPPPEYYSTDADIDLVVQHNGAKKLLFIANPTAGERNSHLRFSGKRTFKSNWGTLLEMTGENSIALSLPAYTVQIWEVIEND